MGVTDGVSSGVGYACGCWSYSDGTVKFCGKPKHRSWSCGCKNIGGNSVRCDRHLAFGIIAFALGLLGASAAVNLLFF